MPDYSTNAASSFVPVIAGALTRGLGWRLIFWLLVILTGIYIIIVVFLLPETQRKLVGSGNIPTQGMHKCLFDRFTKGRLVDPDEAGIGRVKRKHHLPSPFKCIPMLFYKGNFTIIFAGSITYTVKMTLQKSSAAQCIEVYDLNYPEAGLIYLPSGISGVIASYTTGTDCPEHPAIKYLRITL